MFFLHFPFPSFPPLTVFFSLSLSKTENMFPYPAVQENWVLGELLKRRSVLCGDTDPPAFLGFLVSLPQSPMWDIVTGSCLSQHPNSGRVTSTNKE